MAKKTTQKYLEELVDVYVRKPEGEAGNAFVVTLNGVNYQIRYGEHVKVPRKIAMIIEESERNTIKADLAAAKFIDTCLGSAL